MIPSLPLVLLSLLLLPPQEAPPAGQQPAAAEQKTEIPAISPAISLLGKDHPAMVLTDTSGKLFDLATLSDKVVVLEWTQPDCRFTRRLYTQHRIIPLLRRWGKQDVKWISINSTFYSHPEKIKPWHEKYPIQHPYLLDQKGTVAEAFGVKNCPTYLVLDRGKIIYHGAIDDDVWGRNLGRKLYLDHEIPQVVEALEEENPLTPPYAKEIRTRLLEDISRAAH
jgi:peroxiredoxin